MVIEEGYDGDRVRLLVGSFNVGNSPITDLAPWLPYGGKGYDLIVVGLQESTYRAPRGSREVPSNSTSGLSPANNISPSRGVSPRWAAMQAGNMDDGPPSSYLLSSPSSAVSRPPFQLASPPAGNLTATNGAEDISQKVTRRGKEALEISTSERVVDGRRRPSVPWDNWTPKSSASGGSSITSAVGKESLFVQGLKAPRESRELPSDSTTGLSPANNISPSRGVSPRWAAMQAGNMDDGPPSSYLLSSPISAVSRPPFQLASPPAGNLTATNGAEDISQKVTRRGKEALEISASERVVDGRRRPSVPWDNWTPKSSASGGSSITSAVGKESLFVQGLKAPRESRELPSNSTSGLSPANNISPSRGVSPRWAAMQAGNMDDGPPSSYLLSSPISTVSRPPFQLASPPAGNLTVTNGAEDISQKVTRRGKEALEISTSERVVDGRRRPSVPWDNCTPKSSASGGSSITSAVGKESLFVQGLKAMQKRRKGMDEGAQHLRSMLSDHLGPDFVQVVSRRRMQMRVKLYLRRSLLNVYGEIDGECASKNTGIAKIVANKGGLVCKLRLRGTTLCFVSCHLQAHEGQNHLARRNASCAEILQGARLGERPSVDLDMQFHHVFWFGDLNYRVNFHLPHEKQQSSLVSSLVNAKNWPILWEGDELLRELKAGHLLAGFKTEPPAFAPTFKTIRGERDGYHPKRVPSFTDRILWKSLPGHAPNLELQNFASFPEITSSDHKPVHATFTVKLTPEFVAPSPEGSKRNRRRTRTPAVLEVPRMEQPPPVRLVFEDLEATGLPEAPGGGLRNPFVMFSSDPKHLIKTSSAKGKLPKTEIRRRTLDPRWSSKTCQLTVSDPVALRHSHVCLIVMNREQGVKDEILGVANFSLAEATWVNSQRPAPAPAATGRPAARQSSIASSRSGLQSSPQRSRGVQVQSPPENRTLFATVGDIYCDAEGDADDFDDTGIDFDGVDLEEEDADVGAARGSVEEIPAFDLLLVRNGLPRGRIRGRCSLLLGPEKDGGGGGILGRGSAGFDGVGTGMTSVAGGQGDGFGGGGEDVPNPRLVPSGRSKAGLRRLFPGLLRVLRYLGLRGSSAKEEGV